MSLVKVFLKGHRRASDGQVAAWILAGFAFGLLVAQAFPAAVTCSSGNCGAIGAAWAQAILSGLAIIAAALIPTWQERKTRRQKIDLYVDLVSRAESEAQHDVLHYGSAIGSRVYGVPAAEWVRICKIFDAIPLHELPDFRLSSIVVDAHRASQELRDLFDQSDVVTAGTHSHAREQHRILLQCYEDAVDLSNGLR